MFGLKVPGYMDGKPLIVPDPSCHAASDGKEDVS
jgi:hypothetical protein